MKICAVICEFNPFHNGHAYLIDKAKEISRCDAVLCIMSGDFTQRGDMCIFDKYTRARHAVLGGADCVIQLPAAFAVAPAEIFAAGAVKILSAIPDVTAIAFGCENGETRDFVNAADILGNESAAFSDTLNESLKNGESYIRSYAAAFAACGGDINFISSPNNILGIEYTKAFMRLGRDINIIPVKRRGAGYNSRELADGYSSASAIRNNLADPKLKNNLPEFVCAQIGGAADVCVYESYLRHSLFNADAERLKRVYGCGEGLENRLKSLENLPFGQIIERATSKRYSSSRIRRILAANALGLYQSDTEKFLTEKLYIKPLAVKKESADALLSALAKSEYPVVTGITPPAYGAECFGLDLRELQTYNHLTCKQLKDYMITV